MVRVAPLNPAEMVMSPGFAEARINEAHEAVAGEHASPNLGERAFEAGIVLDVCQHMLMTRQAVGPKSVLPDLPLTVLAKAKTVIGSVGPLEGIVLPPKQRLLAEELLRLETPEHY